ncbi:hypothetical protein, partial [Xenorhabdus vietnamensis]|uniref:hypothetical protein n=1 Tax=Xenorhabdus vietnamensis TaxID=351656 RepID=UPI00142DD6BE
LASAHTDCLIQLLKSIATDDSFPGCEAAYLTLFASEVKRLFSLFFAARRGVSQLSVGQWWRIIGSFPAVTIVFFEKNYRLLNHTAKPLFIPTYSQHYPQNDILVKFTEHNANVCVTIHEGKITHVFSDCFEMLLQKPFFL